MSNKILTQINSRSKWTAMEDIRLGIGSHTRNPNTTSLIVPKGTIMTWDGDSNDGYVWFYAQVNGVKHRGKIGCGRITTLVRENRIELYDNADDFFSVYSGEFLQQLINF